MTPPSSAALRVAIVGCGAVVERFHLPASRFVPELRVEILVDRDERRAASLASLHGIAGVATDFRSIVGKVDAAIVALPHALNASVATELLDAGVALLVEKPMALGCAEGGRVCDASERGGTSLRVGYTRRFAYGVQFVRRALRDGLIGEVTGFSVEDGFPFDWKSAAAEFRLGSTVNGGGVLLDFGCHVFDMLQFWFGDLEVKSALHDCLGGVEVNAIAELATPSGVRGTVELSWERTLRNTAVVEGTAGRLEIEWYRNGASAYVGGAVLRGSVAPEGIEPAQQTFEMMFVDQLRDWAGVLRGRPSAVLATGREAAKVLGLVEACRDRGSLWQLPWSAVESAGSGR